VPDLLFFFAFQLESTTFFFPESGLSLDSREPSPFNLRALSLFLETPPSFPPLAQPSPLEVWSSTLKPLDLLREYSYFFSPFLIRRWPLPPNTCFFFSSLIEESSFLAMHLSYARTILPPLPPSTNLFLFSLKVSFEDFLFVAMAFFLSSEKLPILLPDSPLFSLGRRTRFPSFLPLDNTLKSTAFSRSEPPSFYQDLLSLLREPVSSSSTVFFPIIRSALFVRSPPSVS